ncbi:MAG TPA: hypothetical protein VFC19_04225 [Candidatus Limnocylindrales bacterium]|nr:hypothetical protein [Candidatus Limnocylindrales bacterium]
MAILVPPEHDLPILRITVGTAAQTRSEAIFQALRLGGEPNEIARCPLRELGLPLAAGQLQQTPEQAFRVPENVFELIKSAAGKLGPAPLPPQEALWLELYSPRGYLYVLPWERMLAPLGRPLLRRPQHALRPAASESALSVALCASAPVPVLQQLCRIWHERSGRRVKIHVFTDVSSGARMREWAAGDGWLVVPDPPPDGANPWLPWIRDAVQGSALDVVHFVGHGYLNRDRGAIALAGTSSRYIGAPEMTSFLSRAGAWCLVLTGAGESHRGNHCPAGLRELADAVSLAGPFVTAAHEMAIDGADLEQLGNAVATMMGRVPERLDPMPAVTCWVHPRHITSSFIDASTHVVLERADTPAWVASATRTVEALQAKWLPRDPGAAMDPDAMAALESISSLVGEHVSRTRQDLERSGS